MTESQGVEHHTGQLNGVKLHYAMAGSGPPVMLVHGWPQTWFEWRHVMALLASDYTVIAPDLRGFGYTSKPAGGYDALSVAGDIAALSEHLQLSDLTLIGHDWGAVFAYAFAATRPVPLTIPVRAYGGEACLGGLTLQSVRAVAPRAEGGVIERCGHWAAEERPRFVADLIRELKAAG